ncbi:GAD-like domain-containing protein [Myroides sp. DF42-4-2]|uniref:GAD-like domain-containing protein n=1 Tax=Myroides sp. DF42-4-2 TaxID=2746726 RepID=UPI002574B17C|nr:GAD-like domain-containing protein [Myroides sp. DF42-4-2]MDM1408933.1 DUF1851 domain-containing protein [Myroides sp. DF42-4-2]
MSLTEKDIKEISFQNFLKKTNEINGFKKYSEVPQELINKFKGIVPDELIYLWKNYGFGMYADGFLQLVNPEEYEFVFNYIDKTLLPSFVFGITALGDILVWEGLENWTVAPDEGDRCYLINIRQYSTHTATKLPYVLNLLIMDGAKKDKSFFDSAEFFNIRDKFPPLKYGECYGYVPAIPLGGKRDINNIQILDTATHFEVIGEMMGKVENWY